MHLNEKLSLNRHAPIIMPILSVVVMMLSETAFSRAEIQCNKKQTKCVSDTTQLTIGDSVGVFNDDGELVATGEVIAMKGERRAVQVDSRSGVIQRDYNLALLETKPTDPGFRNAYTIYRDPPKMSVGATAGLSTVSIGAGSPGMEYTVFGQYRVLGGLQLIGRGVYMSTSGEVSHLSDRVGLETRPFAVDGLGLLGGVGYVIREGKTISFRGELGIGGMFVSADVDGDTSLVDSGAYELRMKNGVNPFGRGTAGIMINVSGWHGHIDVAEAVVAQAAESSLALGLSKDLK